MTHIAQQTRWAYQAYQVRQACGVRGMCRRGKENSHCNLPRLVSFIRLANIGKRNDTRVSEASLKCLSGETDVTKRNERETNAQQKSAHPDGWPLSLHQLAMPLNADLGATHPGGRSF